KGVPRAVQNILIVRLDHIGDLICSLPVLPVLKRRFPSAEITVLTGEEGKAILAGNPFVAHLVTFSPNWFSRKRFVNPIQFFRIIYGLRKTKYDLGFDLRGDLRNIVLMILAGVRYRIGYGIGGGGSLLQKRYEYDPTLHQVELNQKLVAEEVVPKSNLKPEIYVMREEKETALKKLRAHGVPEKTQLIAIHPEAGYPSKEWEAQNFRTLIEKILMDSQNTVLVFGLSKARQVADFFSGSGRVINLVGQFSLREMIAALSCCDLFIGNDSGPSHIAQALGIPMVILASGTNEYEKWGVWSKSSTVLKYSVPCSPCQLEYCNVEGHPCMSQISPDQVWQAACSLSALSRP
ncbi:MAG: glycosyltransferase family 9 protein, partial [Candidatus Omnitrophica bacterium]|nr:glycosyltransferase family 9 protein [Candidatus Omnitrophota bacterium]